MIKLDRVNFSYGDKEVLKDLDASFEKNKFIGIIGPNGSGKSTMLKCIYRVLEPKSGSIYLDSKNLSDMPVKDSAKIMSVVAQHNHSSFDFIVHDMVLMGRSPYKKTMEGYNRKDYDIADKALKAVDMTDYKSRQFSTLSGGEMQRIILARALCQEPRCLVLDEPTNHLDIKHQLMLLNIVKDLNITVVAAIHDMNIALNYCDYVYVMKDGMVYRQGLSDQVIVPEVIRDVFGVNAKIIRDGEEKSIIFKEVTK